MHPWLPDSALAGLAIAVILGSFLFFQSVDDKCTADHGKLARGVFWVECVKPAKAE